MVVGELVLGLARGLSHQKLASPPHMPVQRRVGRSPFSSVKYEVRAVSCGSTQLSSAATHATHGKLVCDLRQPVEATRLRRPRFIRVALHIVVIKGHRE